MNFTFTFNEAQNLEEVMKVALSNAGEAAVDPKTVEQRAVVQAGLEHAENEGDAEVAERWRQMLLTLDMAAAPIEARTRGLTDAVARLLHSAGLGLYAADFTVAVSHDIDAGTASVTVTRGPGEKIDFTPAPATGETQTLTPDAATMAAAGLGGN